MMRKTGKYIGVLLLMLFTVIAYAGKKEGFDFIENKGQWENDIRFRAAIPDGILDITDKGFAYHYMAREDRERIEELKEKGLPADSEKVRLHNYRVRFEGGKETVHYSQEQRRNHYINYFFGKDPAQWKGNIGLYGRVVQHGVYEGIDVAVYSKTHSLKYDFVIAPGADPRKIRLRFEGVLPQLTTAGTLFIKTSVNEITEQAPYAYQQINGKTIPVKCHFKLTKDLLSFELPEGYNTAYPLVIDPELIFTTFSGAGDFFAGYYSFCTTYDDAGCLYAAGVPVWSLWPFPPQWPVTPGAFQTTYSTIYGPMVCINKYNATGTDLVYSTYFGGSGPDDLPHAMIVNPEGELILAGSTGSFDLPVTAGCFDNTKSGGTDIFIAHFNSDCTDLVGATYVGGNIGNSINGIDIFTTFGLSAGSQNKTSPIELTLDATGNIWAVCNTSTSDFPITPNAFQSAIGGGNCDGVVFSLDPACEQMLFGSFIGGNSSDAAYGIQFNHEGNVVICGGTKSNNFPTTAGALHTEAPGAGEWDGFVSIINPVSGALLHSTYLGTAADDQAVNLQIDPSDNVYVLGRTFGAYPVSPGTFSVSNADLFIDKLSPGLATSLLSTRLGNPQGSGNAFFPTAFLLDNCTNVYVTGLSQQYTIPLANMPLTPNAFQSAPGNFWFGVLKPGFSDLLFGTYYGRVHNAAQNINGDHTHVGVNRMDPQGILYQSLCVNSSSYPGTGPQSWAQFNQNTVGQDIVSFKFAFHLAGVTSDFGLAPGQSDSGCAPYTVQFQNNATMAMTYTWDFGDGSPVSNDPSPVHTYLNEGIYTVSLIAHNDTACITDDTSYRTITIFDPQIPDITVSDTLICNWETAVNLQVQVNNPSPHNRFRWRPPAGILSSDDQQQVTINPAVNTVYTITVWDTIPGFCGYSVTDTIHIDYKPRILDIGNNDTLVCYGTQILLQVNGTPGYTYQWTPTTGVASPTDQDPILTATQAGTYTVTASYPGCADTAQSIHVAVDLPAAVHFDTQPDSICMGQSITLLPYADSTTTSLVWQFGDGTQMTTPNESTIRHAYDVAGHLPVILSAQFRACPGTSFTDTVYVYDFPKVYLGPDNGLCLNGLPITLQNLAPPPGVSFHNLWSTGDTTTSISIVHPGIYNLTVSNEPLGCSTTESVTIHKDCYIDIPNAFTPNGDGVNNYFFPRSLLSRKLTRFHMQILNRWGQVVFETKDTKGRGWDGRFNGKEQPVGVYIYLIEAEIDGHLQERYQGNVTLIR